VAGRHWRSLEDPLPAVEGGDRELVEEQRRQFGRRLVRVFRVFQEPFLRRPDLTLVVGSRNENVAALCI
jgi:hypothetical protein